MAAQNIEDIVSIVQGMMDEIRSADPIFMPGAFWEDLNRKNLQMLQAEGLENFKRTVSQNYFNWFIAAPRHPLFRHALKQWLLHPTLLPFNTSFKEAKGLMLTTESGEVRVSRLRLQLYRLYVCFVWSIMQRFDHHCLREKLSEPLVGNPFRVMRGNKLLSQDIASSMLECNILADIVKDKVRPKIAEVGAGYGRVAHAFLSTYAGQYFIFDIPPALAVSQWYLEQTLGAGNVFRFRHFDRFEDVATEMEAASVVMLTPNQIEKFPDRYFDVMLSISSLPEMRQDQAELYLREFQRLSKGQIFLKQFKAWKNPSDGTDLTADSYKFGPEWRITIDRTDPVVPFFFNKVWSRA